LLVPLTVPPTDSRVSTGGWHRFWNQRQPDRRPDGLYSVHGVAAFFHTTEHIVRYWMNRGWLKGAEGGGNRPWWLHLDRATIKRLYAAQVHGYGPNRCGNPQSQV